ncbi:hypothetical protein DF3PB_50050 [uncultured Defluviicoccus sp.]|uniref:Uncharacterized protein n=1 Tax=metagenome TaxID=256318 RepID=A0A380TH59_9ZZZZ|nr:hypothetical protein DF3PB_50050 [uncultured Defluviicoccus sp.]
MGRLHDVRQGAVGALGRKLDRAGTVDVRCRDLALDVLEALRHHDLDPVWCSGHRVLDGLDIGFEHAGDAETGRPGILVERERHRSEDRIVHLGDDQAEDMKQRAFRRILPRHDLEEGLALPGAGPLVDDGLHLAIPFVQRSGEGDGHGEGQAVEPNVVEVSFGDVHAHQALALTVGWPSVEVAGATESAVAVLDPLAFEAPIRCSHGATLPGWLIWATILAHEADKGQHAERHR